MSRVLVHRVEAAQRTGAAFRRTLASAVRVNEVDQVGQLRIRKLPWKATLSANSIRTGARNLCVAIELAEDVNAR